MSDVAVVFPDGTRIPGSVVDGWFLVEGEGPSHAGFDVRFEWTLRSGTQRSAALDSIDAKATGAERCAVVDGCIGVQLEQLRREAAGTTDARALDDDHVDDLELAAAVDRTVECLAEHGLDAVWTGRQLDVHVGGIGTDDGETVTRCQAEHLDRIHEAADLVDARERFDTDGPALGTITGELIESTDLLDACTAAATPHPSLGDLTEDHFTSLCAHMLQEMSLALDVGDAVEWCRAGDFPEGLPFGHEQFGALCAHVDDLVD